MSSRRLMLMAKKNLQEKMMFFLKYYVRESFSVFLKKQIFN